MSHIFLPIQVIQWLWPEGQVPPRAPTIIEFTVNFEKLGIYDYVCTIHQWMTESTEVR
jgi:plastocyanin